MAKRPPTPDRHPSTRTAQSGSKPVGTRAFERKAARAHDDTDRQKTQRRRSLLIHRSPGKSARDYLRRVPRGAWICALIACLNALCWSIITPPFETPDEPSHIAYVKYFAETGALPTPIGPFSTEEAIAFDLTHLEIIAHRPQSHTITSRKQDEELQAILKRLANGPRESSPSAGVAAGQPPLYYALESIPYTFAGDSTLLARIQLMRFFSALFGALTAFFGYLFIRETLPRAPWAWPAGGMAIALMPLFGEMSGAVNPDSMLYAVSAALFFGLARGFRRGFSRRLAVLLGVTTAIGFLTKLNFAGLSLGVLAGIVALAYRRARADRREAATSVAIATGIAFSPVLAYLIMGAVSGSSTNDVITGVLHATHGSPFHELSFIWQMYLPRLPGMHAFFPGIFTTRQVWFNDYVGQYGWLDTTFPAWVETLALIPAGIVICLLVRELALRRAALRARVAELGVYSTMAVGLLLLTGATAYAPLSSGGFEYGQLRYLLPLLPLFGVAITLALRGAGRRWGPAVGALLVMLFLAHDILSQLQTVARFYG